MPMRSQIDTSIYNNFKSDSSIGDIMNLVNGIVGMTRYAKANRKQRKEDEDLEYINSTIGKHMQGYNGDPNDMMQRRRNAYNELITTRPELNSYLGERYDNDLKSKFDYDNKALELQSKRLGNQNDNEILKGNQLKNMDSETLSKIKRVDDFTTGMVDVADQSGYEWWRSQFHDGRTINIPHENYQDFMVDPKMSFYRDLINQKKQKKLAGAQADIDDRDLKMRTGEANLRKIDSETVENYANAAKYKNDAAEEKEAKKRQDLFLTKIDNTLRNDKFVKNYTDQLGYAGNTVSLLMSDNPVANQAAKTQLARLSGEVGVLTDRDIERFGGSKAVVARAKQAAKEAMSGKLTRENREFLLAVAQRFEENARTKLDERLNNLAVGQSTAFGIPYEMIAPLVQSYGSGKMASPSAGSTGSSFDALWSQYGGK